MPELSIILPTYNERDNVPVLFERLKNVLADVDFEVIVADDDSPDGTSESVRRLAQTDPRIRIVQRIDRRGLSSACVEGMLASSAPYIAVMDADLQHDETVLPKMLHKLKNENLDIVIGSRHAEGGDMGEFAKKRVALSEAGRWLSRTIAKADVSDPMSGFFMLRRTYLDEVVHSLSIIGFKILLDLLASSARPVRIGEVGYRFRNRLIGESKLDILVGLEYLQLLADKFIGGIIPVSYILFGFVGTIGLLGSLTLVFFLLRAGVSFFNAQLTASTLIIALNFFLNNMLTFRSARLRGANMVGGLITFYIACLIGLLANLRFAGTLRDIGAPWQLASLAGILIASVWNYWVSSIFVWRVNRRSRRRPPIAEAQSISAS